MKRLCPILFILALGCASVPTVPAMTQLDDVIKSGVLSPTHEITKAEKITIKAALVESKKELQQAEKKNKSLSFWSYWGKIGASVLFIFILLAGIKKALF